METRYNSENARSSLQGKNISQVLDMTVNNAVDFFPTHSENSTQTPNDQDVGLGYVTLGQPAYNSFTGGEAQRYEVS